MSHFFPKFPTVGGSAGIGDKIAPIPAILAGIRNKLLAVSYNGSPV